MICAHHIEHTVTVVYTTRDKCEDECFGGVTRQAATYGAKLTQLLETPTGRRLTTPRRAAPADILIATSSKVTASQLTLTGD